LYGGRVLKFQKQFIRFLCIAVFLSTSALTSAQWAFASPLPNQKSQNAQPTPPPPGERIDINRASESELMTVPGMGKAYADRIIANRPYRSKYEIVTRGILSRNVYNQIKDWIVAHRLKKK
jgi:DNA uptake protein ComE-like DNA-binding protein